MLQHSIRGLTSHLTLEPFLEAKRTFLDLKSCVSLKERIMTLAKAILLMIPIINVMAHHAFLRFSKPLHIELPSPQNVKDPIKVLSAGVVPLRIHQHKIQYLLGKEAWGVHKDTWADFGGKALGDETAKATAAREAFEETRGLLGSKEQLYKALEKAPYIETQFAHKNVIDYRMYFLFLSQTERLNQDTFSKTPALDKHHEEKTAIAWVDCQDIHDVVRQFSRRQRKYQPITFIQGHLSKLRAPFCRTLSMNYGDNLSKLLEYNIEMLRKVS